MCSSFYSACKRHVDWRRCAPSKRAFAIYDEYTLDTVTGWSESSLLGANVTQFLATPLQCETTYTFRVRAYRGTDNLFSLYSDTVSATTADCFESQS